jgi:hypothetical protein
MWDPVLIGRRGGLSKSERKVAAARRNARLGGARGGRPPKLPPEPEGYRESWQLPFSSPDHALKRFATYYSEVVVKKNQPAQFYTERDFWAVLRLLGRLDLLTRRKKWWAKQANALKTSHRRLYEQNQKMLGRKSEREIRVEAIIARMQGTATDEEPYEPSFDAEGFLARLFENAADDE